MEYNCFPFRVPEHAKDSKHINSILAESFHLQKRHGLSNACGFVNIVLKKCFDIAGFHSKIIYGQILIDDIAIPHVWSDVSGEIVDNTYVEDIPDRLFIQMKKTCRYEKSSSQHFSDTSQFLGDMSTHLAGIGFHNDRAFEWMFRNTEKYMMLAQNKIQMKCYYRDMSNFMQYNMSLNSLRLQQNDKCWRCDEKITCVITCERCHVARYCSRHCMCADRLVIHQSICLLPLSK